jgi:hypothetical protein
LNLRKLFPPRLCPVAGALIFIVEAVSLTEPTQ